MTKLREIDIENVTNAAEVQKWKEAFEGIMSIFDFVRDREEERKNRRKK